MEVEDVVVTTHTVDTRDVVKDGTRHAKDARLIGMKDAARLGCAVIKRLPDLREIPCVRFGHRRYSVAAFCAPVKAHGIMSLSARHSDVVHLYNQTTCQT